MLFLARLVRTVASIVALIIVVGILLFVLGANQSNDIVSAVMDAGRWLVGPFDGYTGWLVAGWGLVLVAIAASRGWLGTRAGAMR